MLTAVLTQPQPIIFVFSLLIAGAALGVVLRAFAENLQVYLFIREITGLQDQSDRWAEAQQREKKEQQRREYIERIVQEVLQKRGWAG